MTIVPRPRVYALEALTSEALALAEKHFDLVKHTDPDFPNWRQKAEGLLVRNAYVTPEDVEVMSRHKLRYIAKQGVGVDNFDLDSLRQYGIPLMNTPGVNAQAVAELAFGLIMSVARGITTIDRRIRAGEAVTKLDGWNGLTLQGRTLGVIGGGNIGLILARMFHLSFGGKVVLYDPYLKSTVAWQSFVQADNLIRVESIDDVCELSDIISIHVPLTSETRHCISTRQFGLMKKSAILINSARGGIVDEEALQVALQNGDIFGAGLDAFVSEPPSLDAYKGLCGLPNVVMTPHIGAATEAAQQATSRSMVEHLVEAFQGAPMRDRVA